MLINPVTARELETMRFSGGQSYLFKGCRGIGRMTYAREAVAGFLGVSLDHLSEHPDYFEISTNGKLGMSDFDGLREFCRYLPAQADCKVAVVDAESVTEEAQDALLKLLEDGAVQCMFILILNRPVLATVSSRCRSIEFRELTDSQMQTLGGPLVVRQLSFGSPGLFFELSKDENKAFVLTCEQALAACLEGNKIKLLEVLHLVKEKDRQAFFECFGQEKTVLFLQYLGDRMQEAMLGQMEADMGAGREQYRQLLILIYGEYVHVKSSRSYSKNDFFEFARMLCKCF